MWRMDGEVKRDVGFGVRNGVLTLSVCQEPPLVGWEVYGTLLGYVLHVSNKIKRTTKEANYSEKQLSKYLTNL